MLSTEVQRTLVKSPPELWAELSDAESLARHLGELGEIRITRLRPESEVQWEADRASGTVLIKPSAWGTRVKLSVTHEPAGAETAPQPVASEPDAVEPTPLTVAPALEPTPLALEPADDALEPADDAPEPADEAPEPADDAPEPRTEAPDAPPAPLVHPLAPVGAELAAAVAQKPAPTDSPRAPEMEPTAPVASEADPPPWFLAGEHGPSDPSPRVEEPQLPRAPRLGFFARIFSGLRRGREASAPPERAPTPVTEAPIWREEPEPAHSAPSAIEALQARYELARPPLEFAPLRTPETNMAPRSEAPPAIAIDPPRIEPAEGAAPQARSDQGAPDAPAARAPSAADAARAGDPSCDSAQSVAAAHVTELLTAMLDSLGAAHHRPFSRA